MIATIQHRHLWTVSPAALTLLLADFGLGDMPRPFSAVHPYTTTAERDAFRERSRGELTSAGLLRYGDLPADIRLSLSALVTEPVGLVAMGTSSSGTVLARGCWHERGAVLAWQQADAVHVADVDGAQLVDSIVALIPDAKPARGSSVTVSAATDRGGSESALFEGFGVPSTGQAGAVAKIFSDPVAGCGAFVPFSRNTFSAPVTWFDTATRQGVVRHFATTVERDGTPWTTYIPGDNARIAHALREILRRVNT